VYNYYDMKAGTIAKLPERGQPFTGGPRGTAWWCDVQHDDYSSALLDGSRMCTIATAIRKGYYAEELESEPHAAFIRRKARDWACVHATNDYWYGAPYSWCVGARHAEIITPEEFTVLERSFGEQFHYRGD
jgi:hypothetical protein